MKIWTPLSKFCVWALLAAVTGGLMTSCSTSSPSAAPAAPVDTSTGFLLRTNYHGWKDAVWLSNGRVEAIIVPQAGRIMQFRFAGETEGVFWENEGLRGRVGSPASSEWLNLGGDRVWPAPQSHWDEFMPTNWPPPLAFDGLPHEVRIEGWVVHLSSPVDPHYGIRVHRRIALDPNEPVMEVATTFEKVKGRTLSVGIWGITQVADPVAVYAPLPWDSIFPQRYSPISGRRPPSLDIREGLLSLQRDPKGPHKIGLDTGRLLWVGRQQMLLMESARLPLETYPDAGASAEVSTSPDPLPYVGLEMLAPVRQMRAGERATSRTTYRLLRRKEVDPFLEAQHLLPR